MTRASDMAAELRRQGLEPLSWKEALAAIQARLSPADMERFSRAHRNFVGYRTDSTLARFYGTVFALGVQDLVNGNRFGRLAGILEDLGAEIAPGQAILDVGAGAGYVGAALLRHRSPKAYVAYDPVPAVRDELGAQGFALLPHPPPPAPAPAEAFDVILCVDSLGEVNADDDGSLFRPDGIAPGELPEQMEQRYGFAEKLSAWKPFLAPGGRILLWEPFAYPEAFAALAELLGARGWKADIRSRAPGRNYLEIRPN
jgi:SAM-dependent methyltransferase